LKNALLSTFHALSPESDSPTGVSTPDGFRENETALPHGERKRGKKEGRRKKLFL